MAFILVPPGQASVFDLKTNELRPAGWTSADAAPARHFASRLTDPSLPCMGERIRLKKNVDILGFSPEVRAILKGLKKYGMFVADNGVDWAISVVPDERHPGTA